jgi:hypothetical protein
VSWSQQSGRFRLARQAIAALMLDSYINAYY